MRFLWIAVLTVVAAAAACGYLIWDMQDGGDDTVRVTEDVTEGRMVLYIDGTAVDTEWEDNDSVRALRSLAKDGVTVEASGYGGFEQWGGLGSRLPSADRNINAKPGDIMLYRSENIVVFCGTNTYSYTRLGKVISPSGDALTEMLDKDRVTFRIVIEN